MSLEYFKNLILSIEFHMEDFYEDRTIEFAKEHGIVDISSHNKNDNFLNVTISIPGSSSGTYKVPFPKESIVELSKVFIEKVVNNANDGMGVFLENFDYGEDRLAKLKKFRLKKKTSL